MDSAKTLTANIKYRKMVAKFNPMYSKKPEEAPVTSYMISDLYEMGQVSESDLQRYMKHKGIDDFDTTIARPVKDIKRRTKKKKKQSSNNVDLTADSAEIKEEDEEDDDTQVKVVVSDLMR